MARRGSLVAAAWLGVAALGAALVAPSSAGAAGAVGAATGPTYTDAAIAYTCTDAGGVTGSDGWVTVHPDGTVRRFVPWKAGPFTSGVQWSTDGSEMAHVAAMSATAASTIAITEDTGSYPLQVTPAPPAGTTYADASFAGDGMQVLFTRRSGGTSSIYSVRVSGGTPVPLPNLPVGDNSQPTSATNGDIAFQSIASSGPHLGVPYIWVLKAGAASAHELVAGTMPRIALDSSMVLYLSATGQLMEADVTPDGLFGGGGAMGPVVTGTIHDMRWSPSHQQVVVASGGHVYTGQAIQGSTAKQLDVGECSGIGEVAWQRVPSNNPARDHIYRLYGLTRQETAIAISQQEYPTSQAGTTTADAVVLADSQHFPDGLSAAPLAAFLHAPLLLTNGAASTPLPAVTDEITRLIGPSIGNVFIVGGTGSVSAGIATALHASGYTVTRIAGANRFDTSLAVAQYLADQSGDAPRELFLATGTDFPDGLSAGAAAASYWLGSGPPGGAVLLTDGATLPTDIKSFIQADIAAHPDPGAKVTVTTVGGLADKAYPAVGRISCVGADRYATSACVAKAHFGAQPYVAIASGTAFPDALSGGVLAGTRNAPLLLVGTTAIAQSTAAVPYWLYTTSGATQTAYVFGGPGIIGGQASQLRAIVGVDAVLTPITPVP